MRTQKHTETKICDMCDKEITGDSYWQNYNTANGEQINLCSEQCRKDFREANRIFILLKRMEEINKRWNRKKDDVK